MTHLAPSCLAPACDDCDSPAHAVEPRRRGQKVRRSEGQKVRRSEGQKVRRSEGQKVRRDVIRYYVGK
jgi:hypothetical protein